VVGTRRVYDNRLLMFYLRNRLGERFAADARNPEQDWSKLRRRLERQWREEWEAEQAQRHSAADDEVRASLDAKLEAMRERTMRTMSPATRALFDQAQRSHDEDRRAEYFDAGGGDDGEDDVDRDE